MANQQYGGSGDQKKPDAQKQQSQMNPSGGQQGGNFSQNPQRAAEAGRKGGQHVPDEKRSFSRDPDLASEAGHKGGQR